MSSSYLHRWLAVNSILIAASVLLLWMFPGRVHGAALVAFPLIALLYARGQWTAFRAAVTLDPKVPLRYGKRDFIEETDIEPLITVAEECQYAGMLCMIGGFFVILSAHFTNNTELLAHVENGAPLALGGTFLGVLASRILAYQYRLFYPATR